MWCTYSASEGGGGITDCWTDCWTNGPTVRPQVRIVNSRKHWTNQNTIDIPIGGLMDPLPEPQPLDYSNLSLLQSSFRILQWTRLQFCGIYGPISPCCFELNNFTVCISWASLILLPSITFPFFFATYNPSYPDLWSRRISKTNSARKFRYIPPKRVILHHWWCHDEIFGKNLWFSTWPRIAHVRSYSSQLYLLCLRFIPIVTFHCNETDGAERTADNIMPLQLFFSSLLFLSFVFALY